MIGKVDLDAVAAKLDIDAVLDRVDLVELAEEIIDGVDLPPTSSARPAPRSPPT